jgi:hypothetical protein
MSTLLSKSKEFIFIHIYKVAGTSITRSLSKYEPNSLLRTAMRKSGINPYIPALANFPQHADAYEVKQLIPNEDFDKYYKFAFVRNPWDWQVSLFHYAQQTRKHHQYKITRDLSFDEYIEWRVNNNYRLQKSFITDRNDNLIVDFVGKLENLESDFSQVCSKLNIDIQLPHRNKSRHRSYKEYYTEKTYNLVKKAFADDIEMFGYQF